MRIKRVESANERLNPGTLWIDPDDNEVYVLFRDGNLFEDDECRWTSRSLDGECCWTKGVITAKEAIDGLEYFQGTLEISND